MKKTLYTLLSLLIVISGILYVTSANKNKKPKNISTSTTIQKEKQAELKKWESTPEGAKFKKWEASPQGQKVLYSAAKIRKQTNDFTSLNAVVTSPTLPSGSRLGFGIMIKINDSDYILSFGLEQSNEFTQLRNLKANDKIIIKSRFVSYAPKYSFPIISGEYVEKDNKIIYKRVSREDDC